ncbi:HK97 family phage major capsid protein [Caballeronia novacaledonica]|uniref:HK97 family phage major capsid protein n=1 Tax=Caballeronia novacaledonica TaxID=1544861 RepID=A0A2U3I8J2_9BURK|nr:phage major capsid protein [Caballeronia novacaledonica]SPB16519.1 HK97 family phage major capsid protein [Caballeronia novacaledonica]
MSIQQLRERRDALAKNIANLMENHQGDKWGAEQDKAYADGMAEIDRVNAEIKRNEDYLQKIAANALNGNTDGLVNQFTRTPGAHGDESRALRAYLTGGMSALAQDDLARLQARQAIGDIRNAMSTTTPGEGGYTVATEYFRQLTQAMKAFGGIRSVATTLQTGTGAQMNFPTADATAEQGEIVGQNTAVTALDTTFGNKTLDVYKYSSKKIALPFELIQDSMFDLEGYIQALLALRIGRITAAHFTTGSGTGQPTGIVTAATVGKTGTTGQTATVIYDDLIDLEHSVDPIYRAAAGYLMADSSLKVIRKIKDTQGRPIFVPGYEQGNPGGAPDRLLGRPITIAQEMPAMAANAKSIAFGDFSKYIVREVMDLTMFRMTDSAFTLNGQVGFVAFNRQGGNLIDVGGAVKLYQNSAT